MPTPGAGTHDHRARVAIETMMESAILLGNRVDAFAVSPGSVLQGDDDATPRARLSWHIHGALSIALDHIGMLDDAMAAFGELRPAGPFPLLRAALEAAGRALWILEPQARHTRVLRSLRVSWDEVVKTTDLVAKLGGDATEVEASNQSLLLAMWAEQPKLETRSIDSISNMTEIMHMVSVRFEGRELLSPVAAWSACASLSHGNRISVISSNGTFVERPIGPTASEAILTGDYPLVATMLNTTLAVVAELLNLAERLAAPPGTES